MELLIDVFYLGSKDKNWKTAALETRWFMYTPAAMTQPYAVYYVSQRSDCV